ncbi:uncharacterized protein E0L32_009956 [Thyridium curvatum]|uniref:Uncharacterized protein n=1 Tax=Thyridium curvatum TaxID=1093900 RepID=A0A507AMX0_9PEZI|nr:uncharacterized protein E0L32_009956 [Thyridium curvatum]TPX08617.1 hypothetical protein E0L32_009956 [Thyridium curvatum]
MEPQNPQLFGSFLGSTAATSASAPSTTTTASSAATGNDSANPFQAFSNQSMEHTNPFKDTTSDFMSKFKEDMSKLKDKFNEDMSKFKEDMNLFKENANFLKNDSTGARDSQPTQKAIGMWENSMLELRYQSFPCRGWPHSEAQRIYLATLGFRRCADGVECSGCSAILQCNKLDEVLDSENTPWKEFHGPDCQFLSGKTICGICKELNGVSASLARRHVFSAHLEPRLVGNSHELSQLSSKPLSQVSPAPAPAPARPQHTPQLINILAAPLPPMSQQPFGQSAVSSPQKNLSLSKVVTVVSIEPSSHVLAVASFDAADKTLAITEMTDFSHVTPILTALEVFTRMTRMETQPTDTTTAKDESLPLPKKNSRIVTMMTRSEFDTLRMWAAAVQGGGEVIERFFPRFPDPEVLHRNSGTRLGWISNSPLLPKVILREASPHRDNTKTPAVSPAVAHCVCRDITAPPLMRRLILKSDHMASGEEKEVASLGPRAAPAWCASCVSRLAAAWDGNRNKAPTAGFRCEETEGAYCLYLFHYHILTMFGGSGIRCVACAAGNRSCVRLPLSVIPDLETAIAAADAVYAIETKAKQVIGEEHSRLTLVLDRAIRAAQSSLREARKKGEAPAPRPAQSLAAKIAPRTVEPRECSEPQHLVPAQSTVTPLGERSIQNSEVKLSFEQRYHSFGQSPASQTRRLFLALRGYHRNAQAVIACVKCCKVVPGQEDSPFGRALHVSGLHEYGCQFAQALSCKPCGIQMESTDIWKNHVVQAHVGPLLKLSGNNHEYEQLIVRGRNIYFIDAQPQSELAQTQAMLVASIEPSDHVLVTASYSSSSKLLNVRCVDDPDTMGELPVLTGLQMFTRVTSPESTATSQPQSGGSSQFPAIARESQNNRTVEALMTRAEYSALRTWVDAFKGVWT